MSYWMNMSIGFLAILALPFVYAHFGLGEQARGFYCVVVMILCHFWMMKGYGLA